MDTGARDQGDRGSEGQETGRKGSEGRKFGQDASSSLAGPFFRCADTSG